ncbi:MAG: sodium:solute symporter family protein [Bacillota bacterium]
MGFLIAGRMRELTITTVPEMLERFYSVEGRVIGVIGQLIVQIVITSLQYVAGGAILASMLPEIFTFQSGMLATAIVFVGIALIGGYWAAGLTNIINVLIIYVGVVVGAIMAISQVGGMGQLKASLPAGGPWFDPVAGVGMAMVVAWFVVMITQAHSTQAVIQISFAAKNPAHARNGFILGGLIIFPVGFVCALLGVVAAAQHPGIVPTMALPKAILELNPYVAGLVLAGLWAADVSTASGLLLGSSTLVVGDIWKRFIQPEMTEKQEVLVSRLTVLVLSVFTYILATTVVGILRTLLIGLTLTTAYTVIILFTLFAPKLCKRGAAFWTILVGTLYLALWQFVPAIRIVPHPIYLAWPICLATFLLVAVIDKRPAKID